MSTDDLAVKPALAIVGPTGSGKSELGLSVAEGFRGEIINCDSLQLVRKLDIGTDKPLPESRSRVRHHLIDVLDPSEWYSAGEYQHQARQVLVGVRRRGCLPVFVGGTGLYLRAAMDGLFVGPARSAQLRLRLETIANEHGREYLHRILKRLDPRAAVRIGIRDKPKVIRAIEIYLETGKTMSKHLEEGHHRPIEGFNFAVIGLNPPRESLYRRINGRVVEMWNRGLVEEVQGLLASGVSPTSKSFEAIGYRQVMDYLNGKTSRDQAIMFMQRDTRRYAKRQLTWFRRQHVVHWFDGFGNDKEIQKRVHHYLQQALSVVTRQLSHETFQG